MPCVHITCNYMTCLRTARICMRKKFRGNTVDSQKEKKKGSLQERLCPCLCVSQHLGNPIDFWPLYRVVVHSVCDASLLLGLITSSCLGTEWQKSSLVYCRVNPTIFWICFYDTHLYTWGQLFKGRITLSCG